MPGSQSKNPFKNIGEISNTQWDILPSQLEIVIKIEINLLLQGFTKAIKSLIYRDQKDLVEFVIAFFMTQV